MSLDMNGLGIGPGIFLAAASYAALSAFATGPLVAERMTALSGWQQACERTLDADVAARRPEPEVRRQAQQIDCGSTLGIMLPELRELCTFVDALPVPDPEAAAREAKRRAREIENRRLDRLAAASGTRCSCAVATLVERERLAFAIHAGSARLVTPAPVRDLEFGLIGALNSAPCNALAGGAS